jgi:TRAP-type mannitol/chloroaromatic compound transport system permease small subunit
MTDPKPPAPPPGSQPHLDMDTFLHHTELPETGFSRAVDPFVRVVGQWSAYLWPILVAVITVNVVLRYVFGTGLIEFEELQWVIYAIAFLFGFGWILQIDDHVRIDVLSEHFKFRNQCWVELGGILIALLPFIVVVIWYAIPFVNYSFTINEVSEAPGGLSHRWLIKVVLPLSFAVLAVATVSRLTRVLAALFTKKSVSAK